MGKNGGGTIGDVTKLHHFPTMVKYDLVEMMTEFMKMGWIIHPQTGKIYNPAARTIHADVPWIYVRSEPEANCGFNNKLLFNTFGVFPLDCLKCWKVVVKPRTVKELLELYEVEDTLTDRPCKCGIELRTYTHDKGYGGYFYNRSKEQGVECYADVRGLVDEHISPEVPVTLKRYCTEFEIKFGPSDNIEETLDRGFYIDEESGKEVHVPTRADSEMWTGIAKKWVDMSSDEDTEGEGQPMWLKQHIVRTWLEKAYDRGDSTALLFNEGNHFYRKPKTYHEEVTYEISR